MATTFNLTIDQMYTVNNVSGEPDYVVNVLWTLTGVDGEYTASIGGNTQLAVDDQKPDFVPYAQLTPTIVEGWIEEALGEQGMANFEANVNGQLESQKNPPVSPVNTPLPWSASE
jgi:hypothetical protein